VIDNEFIPNMQKIDDINKKLLERYFHWPSDSDQIWRHLSDYTLVSAITSATTVTFSSAPNALSTPKILHSLPLKTDKKGSPIEDMLVEEGAYKAQGWKVACSD
jgi:hypothetical protein